MIYSNFLSGLDYIMSAFFVLPNLSSVFDSCFVFVFGTFWLLVGIFIIKIVSSFASLELALLHVCCVPGGQYK